LLFYIRELERKRLSLLYTMERKSLLFKEGNRLLLPYTMERKSFLFKETKCLSLPYTMERNRLLFNKRKYFLFNERKRLLLPYTIERTCLLWPYIVRVVSRHAHGGVLEYSRLDTRMGNNSTLKACCQW